MTILHCIPSMSSGGAERQLAYLVSEQVRQGWRVHVVLLYEGPNFARLQAGGAIIHRLSSCNNYDPRLLWQTLRVIRHVKPHIIQTWLTQMDIIGGLASRISGIPWILSERNSSASYPPTPKNRLRTALAPGAQAIVSNSVGGDAYWHTHLAAPVPRYVVPNSLPLHEIAQAPAVHPDTIGLPPGQKMILCIGRLSPEKNLNNLIPALQYVTSQVPAIAYLCGEGFLRPQIERLIQQDSLSRQVRLIGYLPAPWSWMKRADVFVSVSMFEGQPNVVLEAVSCGCPLVLSDIPAHRVLLNEQATLFVDPSSPHEIAQGIARCLSDPDAAQDRARMARLRVPPWSAAEVARQYQEVYHSVVEVRGSNCKR